MNPTSPAAVAARLWPEPDPINFAKRQAIAYLIRLDCALNSANELRAGADELVFPEISRLWIQPTRLEILLSLLHAELRAAARHAGDVLDLLKAARTENDVRNCEERLLERHEKQVEQKHG
jgi:hypothetical protein